MCGIFGVVGGAPDRGRLEASARLLGHRGPDAAGWFTDGELGLAHSRLSLLDLSEAGTQPFHDDEQRCVLVYNGEVYNFAALREELEREGVRFRSHSDTEVVLHALKRWGARAALRRLEGMFALAFFDRSTRELVLARDRFGIKPLLVAQTGGLIAFASEAKAFRPWFELRPNPYRLSAYLAGVPVPTSGADLFENVRSLDAGSLLLFRPGQAPRGESFFGLAEFLDAERERELAALGDEALVDRAEELLAGSVDRMLVADARVGALCSGGIDSSLVMALAARKHKDLAIFHADVSGPDSEREAAEALARHLGLELLAVGVQDADFLEHMTTVLLHTEQPFDYHPNSVPFLQVSRLVRASGVKAVLSGEGADEAFLGYQYLVSEPLTRRLQSLRDALLRALRAIPRLPRLLDPHDERIDDTGVRLLGGMERERERAAIDALHGARDPKRAPNSEPLHLLGYHLRSLLHRNDRLGMAASVEARFPFLDERFIAYALALPRRKKIRFDLASRESRHPFVTSKWILRRLADRYLPPALSRRRKLGFPTSALARLQVPRSFFRDSPLAELLGLDARALDTAHALASRELLVRMLFADLWLRLFARGEAEPSLRARVQSELQIARLGA